MFTFTSTRLVKNLTELASQYTGHAVSARVHVPDELAWWYYHEFGTATHTGGEKYPIYGVKLPATEEYPEARGFSVVWHPGVPALHFVQNSLEQIEQESRQTLMTALQAGNYQIEALQEALLTVVMPRIIDIITESMGAVMHQRRDDGKLGGVPPQDEFHDAATIVDLST